VAHADEGDQPGPDAADDRTLDRDRRARDPLEDDLHRVTLTKASSRGH
jgi:hypothetical protein